MCFVNNGTNIISFEMVRAKKIFRRNVLGHNFHIEITSIVYEFITLLLLYTFVDMKQ